ncbi:MAG TPA: ROK family protein [Candidatus Absconditabacterales bacterium]|nr:ROK family protein [Candidatus Absconditabacterales bacterium]
MILGIDVGGTSVKCGIVSNEGEISNIRVFYTANWVESAGFTESLIDEIGKYLKDFPEISGVGIGFPGLLSADRKSVISMKNIPSVVDSPIVELLSKTYPDLKCKIENDGKCAALGEHYFGPNKGIDNYLMVTLGTGVGGGMILNKKLFIGSQGNATEIGQIMTSNGKILENNLGIRHLISFATEQLSNYPGESLLKNQEITPKIISESAKQGDELSKEIFKNVGFFLGEVMSGVVYTVDISNILIGGGISGAFDFIVPEMRRKMEEHLPHTYTKNLTISRAGLGNDAGLLGAASLIMADRA